MPKRIDPNHLALMTVTRNAIEDLRRIHQSMDYAREDKTPPLAKDVLDLAAVIDRLRLTLKGRIGRPPC